MVLEIRQRLEACCSWQCARRMHCVCKEPQARGLGPVDHAISPTAVVVSACTHIRRAPGIPVAFRSIIPQSVVTLEGGLEPLGDLGAAVPPLSPHLYEN